MGCIPSVPRKVAAVKISAQEIGQEYLRVNTEANDKKMICTNAIVVGHFHEAFKFAEESVAKANEANALDKVTQALNAIYQSSLNSLNSNTMSQDLWDIYMSNGTYERLISEPGAAFLKNYQSIAALLTSMMKCPGVVVPAGLVVPPEIKFAAHADIVQFMVDIASAKGVAFDPEVDIKKKVCEYCGSELKATGNTAAYVNPKPVAVATAAPVEGTTATNA